MTSHFWYLSYNFFLLPLMYGIVKFLSLFKSNIRESIEKRKGLWERIEQKVSKRDWQKPLIWFHVASAGEFLQAKPVIERCISKGTECLLTYSSINAFRWLENQKQSNISGLLTTEFLPFDTIWNARRLIGLIQPSRLVWISYDLWPNLIWEAYYKNIPQSLISAIVHTNSPRTRIFLGRSFYKSLYSCLEHILTVSEEDRMRILSSIPENKNIKVMGEIRCDSVIERRKIIEIPKLPQVRKAGFVFIAASTWPKDEVCIFQGLKEALRKFPDMFLIVAPHEPTDKHLKNTECFFEDFKIERFRSITSKPSEHRILLVDTVGELAGLYHYADMVYVGGAFTSGVHNILEPASMKAKIVFGPRYSNSTAAIEMVRQKIAFSVNNSNKFNKLLFDSLANRDRCKDLGNKSCIFVEKQVGATDLCVPLLMKNI